MKKFGDESVVRSHERARSGRGERQPGLEGRQPGLEGPERVLGWPGQVPLDFVFWVKKRLFFTVFPIKNVEKWHFCHFARKGRVLAVEMPYFVLKWSFLIILTLAGSGHLLGAPRGGSSKTVKIRVFWGSEKGQKRGFKARTDQNGQKYRAKKRATAPTS